MNLTPLSNESNTINDVADSSIALIEKTYLLRMKWSGKSFQIILREKDLVLDLREKIWSLTSVPPSRQKLVGLIKGQLAGDEFEISSLNLKPLEMGEEVVSTTKGKEFMLIGTSDDQLKGMEKNSGKFQDSEQIDDTKDVEYTPEQVANFKLLQGVRNNRKLLEYSSPTKFKPDIMEAPRDGKRLLVLDLDYCVLDTNSWKEPAFNASDFARPHLHTFLAAVSPFYDIVIWSQTSWQWLERKLMELGIVGGTTAYPVKFVLDRSVMFSVYSERKGQPFKHEVKPLQVIWNNYESYSAKNTIHVDDLARNFALNVSSGLQVKAYKDSAQNQSTDKELLHVARYLLQLVSVEDFTQLDHKRFRSYPGVLPSGVRDPFSS